MTETPLEILSRIARLSEPDRHAQRDLLRAQLEPQLPTTLQKQVLACLVGAPCMSRAADLWAKALLAEAGEQTDASC